MSGRWGGRAIPQRGGADEERGRRDRRRPLTRHGLWGLHRRALITHKSIRQDNRVFCGISQVYKSTSAMRSRAPPTTPTLAGPTQQHQLDLGPSNHALRRTRNTHALSRTRRDPPRHHTDVAPLAARPASSRYTTKIRIPHTPSHAPRIADSNGTRQVTNEHTLLACTTVRCTDTRAHRASQTPNSRAITSYTISTFAR